MALGLVTALSPASHAQEAKQSSQAQATAPGASETLNARQQAIGPIAAFAAAGDMAKLNAALNQGLDAGMTVSEIRTAQQNGLILAFLSEAEKAELSARAAQR